MTLFRTPQAKRRPAPCQREPRALARGIATALLFAVLLPALVGGGVFGEATMVGAQAPTSPEAKAAEKALDDALITGEKAEIDKARIALDQAIAKERTAAALKTEVAAPSPCDWDDVICGLKWFVLQILLGIQGLFTLLFLWLLEAVTAVIAKYNNFLTSPVVTTGWILVRDIANLFFILILLIIAFSTILGVEKLHYKQHLMKLLIMAIVINFSKMITGLMIDFSQVVMLTFANGMTNIGAFSASMGVGKAGSFSAGTGAADFFGILINTVLGIFMMLFSAIVLGVIAVMLLARILMLWILTALSPLAFLLSAFPQGQQYAGKWWGELSKNLVAGPVLMFFLWLAFSIQANMTQALAGLKVPGGIGNTDATTGDALVTFAVTVGLLIAGLKFAQESGAAGASAAGKGLTKIEGVGRKGLAAMQGVGKFGLRRLDDMQARGQKAIAGTDLAKRFAGRMDKWKDAKGVTGFAKRFMGKRFGEPMREAIATGGGLRLRTIPAGIEAAVKEYEKRQLGVGKGISEQFFMRMVGGRSRAAEEDRRHLVKEEEEKAASVGMDSSIQRSLLEEVTDVVEEDVKDENGKVVGKKRVRHAKKGMENQVHGILRNLTKEHNFNDAMKDMGMEVTPENFKEYMQQMFAGNDDLAKEATQDLGQLGQANKDAWMYNVASMDPATGRRVWADETHADPKTFKKYEDAFKAQFRVRKDSTQTEEDFLKEYGGLGAETLRAVDVKKKKLGGKITDKEIVEVMDEEELKEWMETATGKERLKEKGISGASEKILADKEKRKSATDAYKWTQHGVIAAKYRAKAEGRGGAQNERRQNQLEETVGLDGSVHFRDMNTMNKEHMKLNAGRLVDFFDFLQAEVKQTAGQNIDVMIDFLQKGTASGELSQEQGQQIAKYITKVAMVNNLGKEGELFSGGDNYELKVDFGEKIAKQMNEMTKNAQTAGAKLSPEAKERELKMQSRAEMEKTATKAKTEAEKTAAKAKTEAEAVVQRQAKVMAQAIAKALKAAGIGKASKK